ncbi:uncharacterized protein LOC141914207 [Tubulanus polymorphus]|uniref:uncharacterized protein LOC141914207 n=1 Tax=Tubulanus polymorphus TaxID=672921 RepID=UPI003DA3DD1C
MKVLICGVLAGGTLALVLFSRRRDLLDEPGTLSPSTTDDLLIPHLKFVYGDEIAEMLQNSSYAPNLTPRWRSCGAVPKRLHQTWMNSTIPPALSASPVSWSKVYPDWEYWFWTDELADQFVARRFPKYVELYRSYKLGIMRADAFRYFVLYEYGGVYADMDVVVFRRFDRLLEAHTALIPEDHPIHSRLVFNRHQITPLNSFMVSTPGHPAIGAIIEALPERNRATRPTTVLSKTGPFMISVALDRYEQERVRGRQLWRVCDAIYIPSHHRFNPHFDETNIRMLKRICQKKKSSMPESKNWCSYLIKSGYANQPVPDSAYTVHNFVHTSLIDISKVPGAPRSIDSIAPKRVDVRKLVSLIDKPNSSIG